MATCIRQSDPAFSIVERYYTAAEREPTKSGDVSVAATAVFRANFLDLVQTLADKQQSTIVLVCHGNEDGFVMSITDKSSVSANTSVLDNVLTLVDAKAGTDIPHWREIVLNHTKCKSEELDKIIELCKKVRQHEASTLEIHIRGCNIGKKSENLDTIRKLLGAKLVTAPSCAMLYASFGPTAAPKIEDWKLKNSTPKTRRREFKAGSSKLVLDTNYAGGSASAEGAIETMTDLSNFAATVYGHSKFTPAAVMPIAAMWVDGTYHLPHESAYATQLMAST